MYQPIIIEHQTSSTVGYIEWNELMVLQILSLLEGEIQRKMLREAVVVKG